MTSRWVGAAAVLLAVAAVPVGPARAQVAGLPEGCSIDESAVVEVMLLIDQSGSLRITDPSGQRQVGAAAVVRSFASLAERVSEVRIRIAGFGTGFTDSEWRVLDEQSREGVLGEVERVASVDADSHTDYVYAVAGAVSAFEEATGASCRVLFWFTDGEHDLDDRFLGDGLDRFYPEDDPIVVTAENQPQVQALMEELVCSPGGYADQLGNLGVSTQVMLLGDGARMDEASRRVLQGMGGDPQLGCGSGIGGFDDVDDANELPFRMACAAQFGSTPLPLDQPAVGALVVSDETIAASDVPYPLATELHIIARGQPGSPPTVAAGTLDGVTSLVDPGSGTLESDAPLGGGPFRIELTDVVEACGFVAAVPPTAEVQNVTPTLYQGEAGDFTVVLEGPRGRLAEDDLEGIEVTADQGMLSRTASGWQVTVPTLPAADSIELTVTATAGSLPPARTSHAFPLNPPIGAPRLERQPSPVVGEGPGPFRVVLDVDGQDGGELCLDTTYAELETSEEEAVTADVSFAGDPCVDVPAGAGHSFALDIALPRQVFARDVLEVGLVSTPSSRPDRSEIGILAVDLDVTPVANTTVVAAIVAGLLMVLTGLLWATLYGINRLVSRVPDPRRNSVRFGEFTAEIRRDEYGEYDVELTESPMDSDLRLPRRTPSDLRAGPLALVRKVPLAPWRAPYAELTTRTDLVAADLGQGVLRRAVLGEASIDARPSDALGPVVAMGISAAQRERIDRGGEQRVPGVLLLDIRVARGRDASRVAEEMIRDALGRIATELTVRDEHEIERTRET